MGVSIAGIAVNILMVVIIVLIVITGLTYSTELKDCQTKQSRFCYSIQCPCDTGSAAPCAGYAKMPAETSGQWYCSNSPTTLVNDNGNII